ncbi:hypothetical protein FGO68_gene7328 [Halteria grandinella]|uniref:Uncharacterized protein n=1 Tax=Halteria grandinella TaxID=5974 RepID=A0A8J8P2Z7_HALGN|nr:hypothetical protein FGO68_gene7328 [Halteria grandinella]
MMQAQKAESALVSPYDEERLKEEIKALKRELNDVKEENKVLKGQNDKYKKRAEYVKSKYNDVKSKASQAERDAANASDSQYRLKSMELKKEVQKITEEKYKLAEDCSQLKVKLLQALQMNKAQREENDKSGKQMKKLFDRLDELEKKEEERRYQDDIQRELEDALTREQELQAAAQNDSITFIEEEAKLMSMYSEPDQSGAKEVRFKLDTDSEEEDSEDIAREHQKPSIKPNNDQSQLTSHQALQQCPLIIRKQLELYSNQIKDLTNQLKEQELKLRLRKNDFDRVHGLELKKDLQNHKERLELLSKQRVEDEKRKLMKGKMDEFEGMVGENRELKEEIGRLRLALQKLGKQ